MSGFIKRTKTRAVDTANPAGGIRPSLEPNVGQYGWTKSDSAHVNQLIAYVNAAKEYAEQAKQGADFITGKMDDITSLYNKVVAMYDKVVPVATRIEFIYRNVLTIQDDIDTKFDEIEKWHADINAWVVEVRTMHREAGEFSASASKSATDAAASAKQASDIAEELRKGMVYRGIWNVEATQAYPAHGGTNSTWDVILNEGSLEFKWGGKTWYWGDRLIYLKDINEYQQVESGTTVVSVNGKKGAVTLNAADVGAAPGGYGLGSNSLYILPDMNSDPQTWNNNGTGWFRCTSSTLNMPSNIQGVGIMSKWSAAGPAFVTYHGTNGLVYIRHWSGSSWGVWGVNFDSVNKPTAADVGALALTGGTLTGYLKNKEFTVTESLDGSSWIGLEAPNGSFPFISAKVAGVSQKVIEFDNVGDTLFPRNINTAGRTTSQMFISSKSTGTIVSCSSNDDVMGINPDKGAYIHAGDSNAIYSGTSSVQPQVRRGSSFYTLYHEGFKPTAADVGAFSIDGGSATYFRPTNAIGATNGLAAGNGDSASLNTNNIRIESWYGIGLWCTQGVPGYSHSFDTRSGNTRAKGEYYAQTDKRVYHEGFKPTPTDLGVLKHVSYNGDLNALPESGMYKLTSGVSNYPTGPAGHGDHVIHQHWDTNSGYQIYTAYADTVNGKMWTRHKVGGKWGAWKQVYDSVNKPTASDVGAVNKIGDTMSGTLNFTTRSVLSSSELISTDKNFVYARNTSVALGNPEMGELNVTDAIPLFKLSTNSYKLYHEGFKPTTRDIEYTNPRTKNVETLMDVIAELTSRIEALEKQIKENT